MFSLVFSGSKITFFLMWMIALPLLIEMEAVLAIWLNAPPEGTLLFARLALLDALIFSVSMPLTTAARAPGKMRFYELSLGTIQILVFPVSWFVLKLGGEPYSVFLVAIGASLVMLVVRLLIVRGLIGISALDFLREVMLPVFYVILGSSTVSLVVRIMLPDGMLFSVLSVFISGLIACVSIYYLGLDSLSRENARNLIVTRIFKLRRGAK